LAQFPGTPLVVISGDATPAEVQRAVEWARAAFLPKTLPAKVLTAALQVILSGALTCQPTMPRPSRRHPNASRRWPV